MLAASDAFTSILESNAHLAKELVTLAVSRFPLSRFALKKAARNAQ